MRKKVFKGKIVEKEFVEDWYIFIGNSDIPFTREMVLFLQDVDEEYWWEADYATEVLVKRLAYAIGDKPIESLEKAQQEYLLESEGLLEAEHAPYASEVTGYLWTDEELKIGGHNLFEEIRQNEGMYIYLEIEVEECE